MKTLRIGWVLGLAIIGAAPVARAFPGEGSMPDRASREQFLKRVHTEFVVELGQLLELDTADTIKLSARLQPFDNQRVQYRLDSWDAMEQIKRIAKGKAQGDVVPLVRKVAENRVRISEIDQQELEELIKGLPADKIAKAAVLVSQYPKRIEQMAHGILQDRMGGPDGTPGRRPHQDD